MPDLPTDLPGLTLDRVGEIERAVVVNDVCRGAVFGHGAHVAAWEPAGHEPVLWVSSKAEYRDGKAIRGGVPVCFPWFGPKADDPDAPAHGTVRTKAWDWQGALETDGRTVVSLATRAAPFDATLQVSFGSTLTIDLTVALDDDASAPTAYEFALHSYFAVADAREVSISGLENARYIDKMIEGTSTCGPAGRPIRFTGETDRVYLDVDRPAVLTDPGLGRRINVDHRAPSVVVWNPWADKSARMGDFGDDEWPGMCCIESGAIGPDAVTLEPGGRATMGVTLSVDRLG
ncbi:MAG: D-hexose-6-phosphate mutarotase [Planctomycetota bacterium]